MLATISILSFVIGVYIVWYFGRKEYLDEEKLIDVSVLSTLVGLILARLSFFVTLPGREEIVRIGQLPNFFLMVLEFFQLSSGILWWVGVIAFVITALVVLWRWRWPIWPIMGVLLIAMSFALTFVSLGSMLVVGIHGQILVIAVSVTTGSLCFYLHVLNGDKMVSNFVEGFKFGLKNRIIKTEVDQKDEPAVATNLNDSVERQPSPDSQDNI
ncbi:prolipoprotein diacylglyceryl transferase [candidate division WWE3 bacterium]|uniref:Prolipoprotein diacylglyceryl transferase n=1 Tax=candidate division WWE3 bacterium TaxID=2053526 RepID=A0A955LL95_UNCKA|nr:prolipoprotein diacylglyceryl transferase [candidate division WWE3 bacterium]